MSSCPELDNVVLDKKSIQAIGIMRKKVGSEKWIQPAIAAGVVSSILTQNTNRRDVLTIGHNIRETDWKLFRNAMDASPDILNKILKRDAHVLVLYYSGLGSSNYKLKKFWEGVAGGCRY